MTTTEQFNKIIESQAEFKTEQAVMCTKMTHLIEDNLDFKKKCEDLQTDQNVTKAIVQKHGIWFTVILSITNAALAFVGYKSI